MEESIEEILDNKASEKKTDTGNLRFHRQLINNKY